MRDNDDIIPRRRRESSVNHPELAVSCREMDGKPVHRCVEGLRVRHCCEQTCRALFAICASCDRGHRYCREACRRRSRQRQVQAAGRRYQGSEAGKLGHRRRQCAYRERHADAPVTHQPLSLIATAAASVQKPLTQCAACGRLNRWINPYYALLPRRRHRTQSATVHISTFSSDR